VLDYIGLDILVSDKHSSLLDSFVSYEEIGVLWILSQGLCSKHYMFFITYKWAQWARVLHYTRLERFATDKRSSLLGPPVSYEESEVFWIVMNGPFYCRQILKSAYNTHTYRERQREILPSLFHSPMAQYHLQLLKSSYLNHWH
jgi:hypothetical protein